MRGLVQIHEIHIDIRPGDQAVVLGAGRKVVVALVTVAVDTVSDAELAALQRVRTRLSDSVVALPGYKRPAGVVMLCRVFSPATGELTANLKLKRKDIEAKYRLAIDALYEFLDLEPSDGLPVVQFDAVTYMGRL